MMVAGWQDDIRKLTFGIELERFIFTKEEMPPSLDEINSVFARLLEWGMTVKAYDREAGLIAIKRELPTGPLVVKNDFCSHIFEVAYPPARTVAEFTAIFQQSEQEIQLVLRDFSIAVRLGGALAAMPTTIIYRPSDSDYVRKRMSQYEKRPVPKRPFSHRNFFAGMSSTHIHLNVLEEPFYPRLPALYSVEYLIPLLYSQSPVFNGCRAHCVRPLMYKDGFAESYRTVAIPDPIPSRPRQYHEFLAASRGFIRDYSFIAPSWHGTVEFRTACSQPTLDEIIELLALRVAIVLGVRNGYWQQRPNLRSLFWNASLTGTAPQSVLDEDHSILTRIRAETFHLVATNGSMKKLNHRGRETRISHPRGTVSYFPQQAMQPVTRSYPVWGCVRA